MSLSNWYEILCILSWSPRAHQSGKTWKIFTSTVTLGRKRGDLIFSPSHVWFAAASFFFFFFNHRHSPKRSSKRKFNEQPSEMTSVSNTWNTGNIERIDFRDILEESNWCLVENVCLSWSTPISKGLLVYSGVGRPRSLSYIRIWVPNYD